jgi:glutaminyl-tRNA synthetase
MSQTVLHPDMLDACVRDVLNVTAPRYEKIKFIFYRKKWLWFFCRVMAVMEPLKVTITNFPNENVMELTVPDFPADESRGSHKIKFDSVIYIERSDFSEVKYVNIFSCLSSVKLSKTLILSFNDFSRE